MKECDEASTFERLRTQHEFVKVHMTARYRLFPLPPGSQRTGVLQLLKRWGWTARPLQPSREDATGTAWELGAATEMPAPTMSLGESYVLITKIKELPGLAAMPGVCASARTRKHWPRSMVQGQTCHRWRVSGLPAAKCRSLPTDMHQIVKDHVSSSSSSSATEDRLQKLEVGLGEVKMQNQKLSLGLLRSGERSPRSLMNSRACRGSFRARSKRSTACVVKSRAPCPRLSKAYRRTSHSSFLHNWPASWSKSSRCSTRSSTKSD